jgi:hypothetical protein
MASIVPSRKRKYRDGLMLGNGKQEDTAHHESLQPARAWRLKR